MTEWKHRPTIIDYWPDNLSYMMAIDENGTPDFKEMKKEIDKGNEIAKENRFLTITGCIMSRDYFPKFKEEISGIKKVYWEDGKFLYKGDIKRVCFHSREIRRQEGPFNINIINYPLFIEDLSRFLANTNVKVISSTIDKEAFVERYKKPYHPYNLSMEFVVERFCRLLNEENCDGFLMLESRGRNEDYFVLNFILWLINNGNSYYKAHHFRHLQGIYFNPKWSKEDHEQTSFISLELADLLSYPIHKRFREDRADKAFLVVEKKLYKYPNYNGCGLKFFP